MIVSVKACLVLNVNHSLFFSKEQEAERQLWIWMYLRWLAQSLLFSYLVLFNSGSVLFWLPNSSYLFLHSRKDYMLAAGDFYIVGIEKYMIYLAHIIERQFHKPWWEKLFFASYPFMLRERMHRGNCKAFGTSAHGRAKIKEFP